MFAIEWMRAPRTLSLRWLGVPILGLLALVVWFMGGPDRADVSAAPLATVAVSGMSSTSDAPTAASPNPSDPNTTSPSRLDLKSAGRAPFVIYTAPPVAPPAVLVSPVIAAPIAHREPPPSLSFSGRMRTSDGRVVVLARWSDGTPVRLEEGKEVGNGFRVERMTEQSVELLNPQTQAMVQLTLPAAPRFETR